MKMAARRGFYWKQMDKDIDDWVASCACEQAKVRHSEPGGTKLFEEYGAFEAITMDIIIDVETSGGHKMILTIVDRATRYVCLVPLKTRSAAEVAKALLKHWIHRWGCPMIIFSDNEAAFTGELLEELARSWGATNIFFAPYQKVGQD